MKRWLFTLLALGAAAVVGAGVAGSQVARELDSSFRSEALGGRLHYRVYLPDAYATDARRYPVVYFLHGLPASPEDYRGVRGLERALDSLGRDAILVAPQGASSSHSDPEYLGGWEQAIARELVKVVDKRFRTIPSRQGRALIGISAGGYGAMMLALHHLDEFAVVESWSGYFHPTNPAGTAALHLGSAAADARASAHTYVSRLRGALTRRPPFIGFYVGKEDERFREENVELDRELSAASVPHVFRLYAGGHEQSLWQAQAPAWLALALDRLAPPS